MIDRGNQQQFIEFVGEVYKQFFTSRHHRELVKNLEKNRFFRSLLKEWHSAGAYHMLEDLIDAVNVMVNSENGTLFREFLDEYAGDSTISMNDIVRADEYYQKVYYA